MTLPVDFQTPKTTLKTRVLDLPEGAPSLTSLYMYIAGSCNLACRHCWIEPNYTPNGKGGQFIPLDLYRTAIEQALPLGLAAIKLTGGEPTLHPQFRELVTFANEAGVDVSMETNGTLVDADLAQFLRGTPHFKFVSVSLDGADAVTHEALRLVPGSFDRAIQGIKNFVAVGLRPQMIATLHSGNANQMEALMQLAMELGCGSIKFNHVQKNGRGNQMVEKEGLTLEEVIHLYKYLALDLAKQYNIAYSFDIPYAFRPIGNLLKDTLGLCNVVNILGVLADGSLSLCGIGVTVPELIYGNLATDSVREIWLKSASLQELRWLVPDHLEGICGECIHKGFCWGNCIALNYLSAQKINGEFEFCREADRLGLFPHSRLING